jgi:YD repeat-containing protein
MTSETYFYDGDGKRVGKTGPGGTTVFVYDALEVLSGMGRI